MRYIFSHRQVRVLFILEIFGWATSQAIFDGVSLFYEEVGLPIALFGVLGAATFMASMAGMYFSHACSEWLGDKRTMFLTTLLHLTLWILATFLRGFWVMIPLTVAAVLFAIRLPVEQHIINLHAPEEMRATLLSLKSLVGRLSAVVAALVVGYLVDAYSAIFAVRVAHAVLLLSLFFIPFIEVPSKSPNA